MSFFERAKAAASDLAAKADVAMTQAGINTPGAGGGADRALRDLGVIAYLEATGRRVDPADRERVLATLRELESSGRLGPLTVTPAHGAPGAPPPPPPPPGYAGDAPSAPPPPPPPAPPTAPPGSAPPGSAPPGSTPPPPPPSWA